MTEKHVQLCGEGLSLSDILQVASGDAVCSVSEEALQRVQLSRARIEHQVTNNRTVYGVTTGFGKLSDVQIDSGHVEQLQINLLRSHAVAVGPAFPTDVVRTMLLLRANALAKGFSGIKTDTLKLLVELLNRRVHPVVPSQGSLGASGDLAPLAHMALVLIGEGEAEVEGTVMSGAAALQAVGLEPVRLGAKEGLALINGTQAMTAVGALALAEARRTGLAADTATALTMEALRGIVTAFDSELLATRPHQEMEQVASRIRQLLVGSKRVTEQGDLRVQDPYSIRCVPQVHGASWQAWDYANQRLSVEFNAATDNPIVISEDKIVSGGQFHGQPIALAMDFLKVAVAEWGNISERRTERLVNPQLSGLSPFLAVDPGLQSGLMITQYVAASLVSENKVLAHPASVDSIPSSANQEDHVSMGTTAARQCRQMIGNVARVIAIEMICASQAIFLQGAEEDMASATRSALKKVRDLVPTVTEDTSLSAPIEALANAILRGDLA